MTRKVTRARPGLRPPAAPPFVTDPSPSLPFELERQMQRHLAQRPDLFALVGWPGLTLIRSEVGLRDRRGRADLLYEQFDGSRRRAVLVEIKRGIVRDSAVSQVLRYRRWIDAGDAGRFPGPSEAILVGEAIDDVAAQRVSAVARLTFVRLAALGIESTGRYRSDDPPVWVR